MDLFKVIQNRKSIREFQEEPINQNLLDKILNAARRAPSAGNLQAYRILIIKDAKQKEKVARAAFGQNFITKAPVVLVFCAAPRDSSSKYDERGENLYSIQDATIAASYAQLAAYALGVGCVWVGAFDSRQLKALFSLKDDLVPIAILPLGFPAEDPPSSPRKPLSEIIIENH